MVGERMRSTRTGQHAGPATVLSGRRPLLHQVPDSHGRAVRVRPRKIRTSDSAGKLCHSHEHFCARIVGLARVHVGGCRPASIAARADAVGGRGHVGKVLLHQSHDAGAALPQHIHPRLLSHLHRR